jgi:hypothetical protein
MCTRIDSNVRFGAAFGLQVVGGWSLRTPADPAYAGYGMQADLVEGAKLTFTTVGGFGASRDPFAHLAVPLSRGEAAVTATAAVEGAISSSRNRPRSPHSRMSQTHGGR